MIELHSVGRRGRDMPKQQRGAHLPEGQLGLVPCSEARRGEEASLPRQFHQHLMEYDLCDAMGVA